MNSSSNQATVAAYRKSRSTVATRRGFGLMLGKPLRDRWVARGVPEVSLELEGLAGVLTVRLRGGFWKDCPEFLHDAIYDWFEAQGLVIPWPQGRPHQFVIERLNGTHFRVNRITS